MSFDEIFDLAAGVYFHFFIIYIYPTNLGYGAPSFRYNFSQKKVYPYRCTRREDHYDSATTAVQQMVWRPACSLRFITWPNHVAVSEIRIPVSLFANTELVSLLTSRVFTANI